MPASRTARLRRNFATDVNVRDRALGMVDRVAEMIGEVIGVDIEALQNSAPQSVQPVRPAKTRFRRSRQ